MIHRWMQVDDERRRDAPADSMTASKKPRAFLSRCDERTAGSERNSSADRLGVRRIGTSKRRAALQGASS